MNILVIHLVVILNIFFAPRLYFNIAAIEGLVTKSDGRSIKILDRLNRKEKIHLESGSFAVIVDSYGNFYEYEGPISVDLGMVRPLGIKNATLPFEAFYEDSYVLSSNEWDRPVHIFSPYNAANGIYAKDSLCLSWTDKTSKSGYNILLRTVLGDTVANIFTAEHDYLLAMPRQPILILTIHDSNGKLLSLEYGIVLSDRQASCRPETAAEAILTGLYLETIEEFDIAHSFYQLSLKLSDRSCIKEIYRHHLKRYEKIKG